jgi:hypothetical protein
MQVAISGASGLIGSALAESLRADDHVVRPLVRADSADPQAIRWDPMAGTIDAASLEGVDAVVHLAGAGIGDHRWTAAYKQTLLESRTKGTGLIARTLAELDQPPRVFICGSAVGFYGDAGDQVVNESSPAGEGFLADLVVAWEQAAAPAQAAGIRTVLARSGIVLTRRGGSLRKMLLLFRLGLGGPFGSGKQWISWITLTDEIAALRLLIDREDIAGPVNLAAPEAVTNKAFSRALGRALHRPAVVPTPRFGPALILGREFVDQVLFVSQRVEPAVLIKAGYDFVHPDIDRGMQGALVDR